MEVDDAEGRCREPFIPLTSFTETPGREKGEEPDGAEAGGEEESDDEGWSLDGCCCSWVGLRTGGRRTLGDGGVGVSTAQSCCRNRTLAGPIRGGGAGERGGEEGLTGARNDEDEEGSEAGKGGGGRTEQLTAAEENKEENEEEVEKEVKEESEGAASCCCCSSAGVKGSAPGTRGSEPCRMCDESEGDEANEEEGVKEGGEGAAGEETDRPRGGTGKEGEPVAAAARGAEEPPGGSSAGRIVTTCCSSHSAI